MSVGRVIGTEDSTPLQFWVAVEDGAYLQLDDVVSLERALPDGRTVREKFYRASRHGLDQWQKTLAFYDALDRPPEGFQAVSLEEYLAKP